ncbi:MAG: 16S rRNA (guanine(966)-N(2))-methyltransferase RsmD [Cardiobacteriaceae bacterium]|nr:16S rRNA (guanine(966)-N(2))-methyltransferase RsmD [Cardiobacteriaceae bacterium]
MKKHPGERDHKIRIIAGKHRGRRIAVPDLDGLRPSPDRVRETVFNWLQFDLPGASVLDAFAGSGAMGLEALSRGAASVLFTDTSNIACERLRTILRDWREAHAHVREIDALQLGDSAARYDIIFLDPPFAAHLHQQAVDKFASSRWLKPGGVLYIERGGNVPLPQLPPGYGWRKQSHAGRLVFGLIGAET